MTSWLPRKVPDTKPVPQLDSRKTQMMQIRLSNTWNSENPFDVTLSLCILMILVLLHINQGLLTCRTVRTKNPWQHDWSQGSRPYDQEELPCCDKVHHATSDTVSVDLLLLFQHLITAGWCRYAKVWAISMFLSSSTIWWWSDWDWWEACSRTNCNTRCCHCTTNLDCSPACAHSRQLLCTNMTLDHE